MIFEANTDAPPVKAPTPRAGKIVLVKAGRTVSAINGNRSARNPPSTLRLAFICFPDSLRVTPLFCVIAFGCY